MAASTQVSDSSARLYPAGNFLLLFQAVAPHVYVSSYSEISWPRGPSNDVHNIVALPNDATNDQTGTTRPSAAEAQDIGVRS